MTMDYDEAMEALELLSSTTEHENYADFILQMSEALGSIDPAALESPSDALARKIEELEVRKEAVDEALDGLDDEDVSDAIIYMLVKPLRDAAVELANHLKKNHGKKAKKPWMLEYDAHPEWAEWTGKRIQIALDRLGKNPPSVQKINEYRRSLKNS